MKTEMPRVLETILRYYSGDCTDCPDWSAGTCAGEGSDNWFTRSHSLAECQIKVLYPTESDLMQIRDVLSFALGSQAIDKTKGLTSTQACGSAINSLSVSNPGEYDVLIIPHSYSPLI
ncbi:hypothetical protein ACOMHN_008384 [Nucella lapillus]